jgi:DNA-binding protein YbaB
MSAGFNLGMLKQAQQARSQQKKYQDMLEGVSVSGQSKNSKVKVVVSGTQKLKSLFIDPELITFVYENYTAKGLEDTMLSKNIMEAIDDAMAKVQMEVVKKMQESGNMEEIMQMLGGMGGK